MNKEEKLFQPITVAFTMEGKKVGSITYDTEKFLKDVAPLIIEDESLTTQKK